MTCRYLDDPPEGAGEAGGAVEDADSPPASSMPPESSPGMNQALEEDYASPGFELRKNSAEEPADGEFFEIIRELYDESDGKTKKQVIPSKCLNIVN